MLTMKEYSFLTPKHFGRSVYRRACRRWNLSPIPDGYGFIHCTDEDGLHWTVATTDVGWMEMLIDAGTLGHDLNPEVLSHKFPNKRAGWPDEWR